MAFRGLQAESQAQGQVHAAIAKELATLVVDPFNGWAQGYKVLITLRHPFIDTDLLQERVRQNRATVLEEWLHSYEQAHADVAKLKNTYLAKVRRADEAEDEYVTVQHSNFVLTLRSVLNSPPMRPQINLPLRASALQTGLVYLRVARPAFQNASPSA